MASEKNGLYSVDVGQQKVFQSLRCFRTPCSWKTSLILFFLVINYPGQSITLNLSATSTFCKKSEYQYVHFVIQTKLQV